MKLEVFLTLVLAVSILVSLTVEALKKVLNDKVPSNIVVGIVSVIISVCVSIGYYTLTDMIFNSHLIVYFVALIFISWLCAMLGYDKVIQTLKQFKEQKGL